MTSPSKPDVVRVPPDSTGKIGKGLHASSAPQPGSAGPKKEKAHPRAKQPGRKPSKPVEVKDVIPNPPDPDTKPFGGKGF